MGLMDAISGGLTAATDVATGQERGQAQGLQLRRAIGLQDQEALDRQALTAATMRRQGFIPDAERGPNERTLLSGQQTGGLIAAVSGAPLGVGMGIPDVKAPRYGASVGGYSYDEAGPEAQQESARLGQTLAQTKYLIARPDLAARTLDVRQSEGQANRDSRESQTGDRLSTQQNISDNRLATQKTIADNRDRIRLQIRTEGSAPDGTPKPVTGTALLGVTARLSREYRKPTYAGGLGLSSHDAMQQAMRDAREMAGTSAPAGRIIAPPSGGQGTSSQITGPQILAPSSSGDARPIAPTNTRIQPAQGPGALGNVDLRQDGNASHARVRHPVEVADDAEQMVRNGKATIDQALNSPYLSDPVKAVLRRKFGKP
jgi:hypothetical protein